jgi:hypothetical protein
MFDVHTLGGVKSLFLAYKIMCQMRKEWISTNSELMRTEEKLKNPASG